MDREVINNLKCLALDMINRAGNGHWGIVMSAAPLSYTVYAKHMNGNIKDPNRLNRDRLVMSAGHGSALLYAALETQDFASLLVSLCWLFIKNSCRHTLRQEFCV